ncbi:hypothetical protein B9Z55_010884 [Caenorhabditis nigoni]|uniref:Uncharacterized protein n=1 Tax=Caenorhabditis nigoni TaxID=1611254 RepID=A0A2G5UHN5_9PELO|nr:hypothetical protein B9Z55_010884 [Caenorhabditis nigoni]
MKEIDKYCKIMLFRQQNHVFEQSYKPKEIARTLATTSTPCSSTALPELEAPEGGPPGYDAISLHNETISTR